MVFSDELKDNSIPASFSAREQRNSFLASGFSRRVHSSCLLLGALQPQWGAHLHVDLGHDQTVICPAFCTSHGTGDVNVSDVTSPHNDIVYQVPVFGTRVHPRSLVFSLLLEDSVGYGQGMLRAESE